MKHNNYTKEMLEEAIKGSASIREVLQKLNRKPAGGNYATIKNLLRKFDLKLDPNYKGMGWNKGKNFGPKRPIEDYLSNNFFIQSHKLRKRLIKEKIFNHQCSCCKNSNWLEKQIPLELDHINGNHLDNSLSNLRLLCPNCHAQTLNYRGKNIGKNKW